MHVTDDLLLSVWCFVYCVEFIDNVSDSIGM
jgi:hypothetical protein